MTNPAFIECHSNLPKQDKECLETNYQNIDLFEKIFALPILCPVFSFPFQESYQALGLIKRKKLK